MSVHPDPEMRKAEDELVLIKTAIALSAMAVGSIGTIWLTGIRWLIEHKILISAEQNPIITLPHAQGAGADLARITLAAAVLTATAACLISAVAHAWKNRRRKYQ